MVDDASSDASSAVIAEFVHQVKAIRLDANRGGAFARNRGADISTGDLILFLDADDLLGPDSVEHMVMVSRTQPESLIACRFSYLVPDSGGWQRRPARLRTYAGGDQLLAWLEGNWSPPCCLLWPADVFRRAGRWNESLTRNDDGDLVMRALSKGARITSAAGGESLYRRHRQTRQSVSTTRRSESHLKSAIQVLIDLSTELEAQQRLPVYAETLSEDLAEIALLSFRAGLHRLGSEVVRGVLQLRASNPTTPDGLMSAAADRPNRSTLADRVYAASIRSRGQARRWLKRRTG